MTAGIIDLNVWAGWIERACQINEYAAPVREAVRSSAPGPNAGPPADDAPGTDFNRRGSWEEAGLFDRGWSWVRRHGNEDRGLICRPGKDDGVSASVGMVTSRENGWPLFWCWSTSVPEFVAEQPYSRFAVFATLRHGGDYKAAARDLAGRGYGSPPVAVDIILPARQSLNGTGATPEGHEPTTDPDRIFRWMSELKFREQNDKWLLDGYISRGGVTMLSALWKAGKSTLLSHLIRAFDGRAGEFIGREITPARVLYVSEEHEELWAERRDELGIGDHVGIVCRPFKGRPSPAEWAAFLGEIVRAVSEHRFDVVIFDTISKLWPVREENDAGQVEDALMPLWSVTNQGTAVVLVHHNRKSDGKEFTGSRGSGGLPAFCETLVEFRRSSEDPKDYTRVLTAAGRYRETPAKLLIELTPSGYVSLGDPDAPENRVAVVLPTWEENLDAVLPGQSPGATVDEIHDRLKTLAGGSSLRNQDLIALLNLRVEGGEYWRLGKGVRGSPFRYYRVTIPEAVAVPPLGIQRAENPGTESGDADSFPEAVPNPHS
jgi:hypothetical protein